MKVKSKKEIKDSTLKERYFKQGKNKRLSSAIPNNKVLGYGKQKKEDIAMIPDDAVSTETILTVPYGPFSKFGETSLRMVDNPIE